MHCYFRQVVATYNEDEIDSLLEADTKVGQLFKKWYEEYYLLRNYIIYFIVIVLVLLNLLIQSIFYMVGYCYRHHDSTEANRCRMFMTFAVQYASLVLAVIVAFQIYSFSESGYATGPYAEMRA